MFSSYPSRFVTVVEATVPREPKASIQDSPEDTAQELPEGDAWEAGLIVIVHAWSLDLSKPRAERHCISIGRQAETSMRGMAAVTNVPTQAESFSIQGGPMTALFGES